MQKHPVEPSQRAQRPDEPLIRLRQVAKKYESASGAVVALQSIDLSIRPGELIVVVGKSGAGKTTLINLLTGLDRATAGEIWVAGIPLHRLNTEQAAAWRGRHVGVVFQSFHLLPSLTVLQNVTLPMDFAGLYSEPERRQRGLRLLEQVGLAEHAHKRPSMVSGGQQQRVAIARALANDPPVLAADEPTGSLDSATAQAVLEVMAGLAAQGKAVVVATHDADMARRAARVIRLADGAIVEA